MKSSLEILKERMGDVNALGAAMALMDWDQQTYMPRGGAEARANHLECLSKMHHDIFIADETRKALVVTLISLRNSLPNSSPERPSSRQLLTKSGFGQELRMISKDSLRRLNRCSRS
jgi:Zn-dependent M32 family carboxypeptidase